MPLTYRQTRSFLYDSNIHGDAVPEFPEDVVFLLLHTRVNHFTVFHGEVLFGELPDDLDVSVPLPRSPHQGNLVVGELLHILFYLKAKQDVLIIMFKLRYLQ